MFKKLTLLAIISTFLLCACNTNPSGSDSSLSIDDSSSNTSSSSTISDSSSSSSSSSSSGSSSSSSSQIQDDFDGYYATISDSMTGGMDGTLRNALTDLIKPQGYYSYSGDGSASLSSVLQEADEDSNNTSNMILFYSRKSIKKVYANGDKNWNREHCWPQSLSGGLYGKTGGGTDILHIRPTMKETNSRRGNLKYGDCHKSNPLTIDGITYGYTKSGYFEPLDEIKGDVARIVLYMWTCYFAERNNPITKTAESVSLMVKWSNNDLPSEQEKHRNDYSQSSKQKNRNPFVDHPEWVNKIFA